MVPSNSESARSTRFRKTAVIAAGCLGTLSLLVYVATLAPTATFVDSGELILAAKVLGVAHPPGFPLYVMLAHLATLVPIGNVAMRVNLASALFAALAVAFLALAVDEVLRPTDGSRDLESPLSKKIGSKKSSENRERNVKPTTALLPAMVAALLFSFSRTLWSFATVAEVYTLNSLLVIVIFYLMFRWRRLRTSGEDSKPKADRLLYGAAFLFGIALGVHHVTVGVNLLGFAWLVYTTEGWRFFRSRRLVYAALISIVGLVLVYAYLPLAAARAPVMNWGDPRTLQSIWWHVSGRQYQGSFKLSLDQFGSGLVAFVRMAAHEFGPGWLPLAFVLAGAGFFELFQRNRNLFYFLTLVIASDCAYSLGYEISEDKAAYYLPSFIAIAIAGGFGARFLLRLAEEKWPRNKLAHAAAGILALCVPVTSFAANLPYCNRHSFYLARDYVSNIESTIPLNGMLLTGDWEVEAPMLYFREVERQRRDLIMINVGTLRRRWYIDHLRAEYPNLFAENSSEVNAFLADLGPREDPLYFGTDPEQTGRLKTDLFKMIFAFITSQMRIAPVYITKELALEEIGPNAELTQALRSTYQYVPQGLVFQLSTNREFQMPATPALVTSGLADGTFNFDDDDVVTRKVLPVYVDMLVNRGRYLAARGYYDEAISAYRQALALDPNSEGAGQSLAGAINARRRTPAANRRP